MKPIIEVGESTYPDYCCGNCFSIVYGDEFICPCCGKEINWNKFIKMSDEEVDIGHESYWRE